MVPRRLLAVVDHILFYEKQDVIHNCKQRFAAHAYIYLSENFHHLIFICFKTMLIEVKFYPSDESEAEWCLLEFQGEIAGAPFNGELLGEITTTSSSNAKMDIGMHTLTGKIVTLGKPFLIFDSKATQGDISCVGIVKKKIIFDTRPNQRI